MYRSCSDPVAECLPTRNGAGRLNYTSISEKLYKILSNTTLDSLYNCAEYYTLVQWNMYIVFII